MTKDGKRLVYALVSWIPGYLLALCWLTLGGCAQATKAAAQPTVVITGCAAFPRLSASRQDTAQTREAILAYVTTWDALCAPATGAKP